MSKEKQIEEMKRELKDVWIVDLDGNVHTLSEKLWDDDLENIATELYGIGYRKQEEGEWILKSNGYMKMLHCSCCEHQEEWPSAYCPNCGARMGGGAE